MNKQVQLSPSRKRGRFRKELPFHLMLLVPVILVFIYMYLPMGGLVIAFQKFIPAKGLFGNQKWVGLGNFQLLLKNPQALPALRNTVIIAAWKIVLHLLIPVTVSILLNEIRSAAFRRTVQTMIYLPHFLSWVVVYGIFYDLLGTDGLINQLIVALGGTAQNFLANSKYFRSLLVVSTAWKESGWSTIVYLSAMTAIDPQLYEAAAVDGAGRLRQTWSITLPCIINTITFIIIMRASSLMGSDTEQVMMFYSPIVYGVGDVLGTFVYREGIENAKFSYTTAVGLFGSVVGMIMMLGANYVSRKYTDKGIW